MVKTILTAMLLQVPGGMVAGQSMDPPATLTDSTEAVPADSLQTSDSVQTYLAETIDDSIRIAFPSIEPDTLTEVQRLLVEFETRFLLKQLERQAAEIQAGFSFFDSLVLYYVSPRWNLRDDIDRSFYHDAGDYFKSDPGFFVLEPQVTPMRKTVQPYGLQGNRLGLLVGGQPLRPFEHILEPDGLVDMNDVPTALDHTVAILPGPVGMLFGGDHSVATLLTLPGEPASMDPESSFLVDKGSFSFSHARGKFSKNFTDGRRVDMSIAYRNADGLAWGRGDDAYHYTGKVHFPLGQNKAVRFDGRLYDRRGPYPVRPGIGGGMVNRDQFDRNANILFLVHNDEHTVKNELGYSHVRQATRMDGIYGVNLNQTGHGFHLAREWMRGTTVVRSSLRGDYLQFDNWHEKHSRSTGTATLSLARLSRPVGIAVDLRQSYVEGYRWLPSVAAMLRRETDRFYVMLAGGYSERAPSLYELYLPYQQVSLYGSSPGDYADSGYRNLVTEKQVVGSLEVAAGRIRKSLSLSVVGGHTWDGIDWLTRREGGRDLFSPFNGDIDWVSITTLARFGLSDFLRFKGGGSYHYLDYENIADPVYSPEFQLFSGLEMHLFWSQKLIDLYAYGEVVYSGPYHGYVQQNLGEQAIVNVKLSFKMGHFRFHFISQNTLSAAYYPKDYWQNPGRYSSYGFTWDFID